MDKKLNALITKYTWLFPLVILLSASIYYINWFERLFAEDEVNYYLPLYKELQISISILLLVTAFLNWALVGFWKHLHASSHELLTEKKHARRK